MEAEDGGDDQMLVGGGRRLIGGYGGYLTYVATDDQVDVRAEDGQVVITAALESGDASVFIDNIEKLSVGLGGGSDLVTLRGLSGTDVRYLGVDLGGGSDNDMVAYIGTDGDDVIWAEGTLEDVGDEVITDENGNLTGLGDTVRDAVVRVVDATGGIEREFYILNSTPGHDWLKVYGLGGADALAVTEGSSGINVYDLISVSFDAGDGDDTVWGSASADEIDGGEGNDVIHGGGGNDTLHGDGGDDVIYGDDGNDHIDGGSGNDVVVGDGQGGSLSGADGAVLRPTVSMVPAIVGHKRALPGNDLIDGGNGNDLLIGDVAAFISPLPSGLHEVEKAAGDSAGRVAADLEALHELDCCYDYTCHALDGMTDTHDVTLACDDLAGGGGQDTLIGDNAMIIVSPAAPAIPDDGDFCATALSRHAALRDMEHLAMDFSFAVESAHGQVLQRLVDDAIQKNPSMKKPRRKDIIKASDHALFLRNDPLSGGEGRDVLLGDDAAIAMSPDGGKRMRKAAAVGHEVDPEVLRQTNHALHDQQKEYYRLLKQHLKHEFAPGSSMMPDARILELIAVNFGYAYVAGQDTIVREGDVTRADDTWVEWIAPADDPLTCRGAKLHKLQPRHVLKRLHWPDLMEHGEVFA